ncbi:Uu.00g128490.m01.CDS01 [Anthostomella pinea]|uniref:Uu.00g128490.m01.CDS01 n=1 Tax=Anthostomella pinea TaxID=933095 RepID=A0AAI8VJ95_9PEZI|nr:Uu.00g128490.m01.CDS01 [Anthostomella pinea]
MATFNSMPAPSPGEAMGLNAAMVSSGLGLESFEPELNFDESMLEAVNGGLPPLPFTPSYDFETFSTTFEDPFNYSRPYEAAPTTEDLHHDEDSSPQQLDDKLLGFSTTIIKATPLDDALGTYSELNMSAELYGMFFVAEDVFGGETSGRPLELTCYRRNLWQCSGYIHLPRHCTQVMNEQGRAIPIVEFHASISAIESIEGKLTEIISIPWKNSNPALGEGQETKVASAPPKILLDLSGGEADGHRVSIPVAWKRLQFKSATANNGRRKGLQQHYVVQISLLGKIKVSGELMKIADIQSGPVIVRGRSPRNFDSRKDVPLSAGEKKVPNNTERTRTQSDASAAPTPNLKTERTDPSQNGNTFNSLGSNLATSKSNEWATPTPTTPSYPGPSNSQQQPAKRLALSPNLSRPPVPSWGKESSAKISNLDRFSKNASATQSVPISLSLSEDERSPNNRSNTDSSQSPRLQRASSGHVGGESPLEEEEELYEYFPLSVDDWTPLVDTIYRPHIVHHIAVPQEIKAQQIRSKSKRYFSAE